MTLGGAEQTVVADFNEAWWEDVLQEAADELLGIEGAVLELVSGRLFIRESDVAVLQLTEAVVADSDTEDVRGEIPEGLATGADGFRVDHPVFAPNRSRH